VPLAIIADPARRGGAPIIAGTSTRVSDVAVRYELLGMGPDEIAAALPHLSLAQIHCALAYYYEHKGRFDREWRTEQRALNRARRERASLTERARARAAVLSR